MQSFRGGTVSLWRRFQPACSRPQPDAVAAASIRLLSKR
jgi:hypothetical protein